MTSRTLPRSFFDPALLKAALLDTFRKLAPRGQARNPVMLVVYAGSILTTLLWIEALRGEGEAAAGFILAVALWLWFTVLFANFAEALAEGRSKAQAAARAGSQRRSWPRSCTSRAAMHRSFSRLRASSGPGAWCRWRPAT
jgi:potassium-transporting ATPase ATP-binding subunit